jgi:cell division protein FtsZ
VKPDEQARDEVHDDDFVLKEKNVQQIIEQRNQQMATPPVHSATESSKERVNKLRSLSMKLNNPTAITEMEKEPAFLRRGTTIKDVEHSSESSLSPYYVESSENPNKVPELRKDNSFLHGNDKVD